MAYILWNRRVSNTEEKTEFVRCFSTNTYKENSTIAYVTPPHAQTPRGYSVVLPSFDSVARLAVSFIGCCTGRLQGPIESDSPEMNGL